MQLAVGGRTIAGVDGCRKGWVAVILRPNAEPTASVFTTFTDLLAALPRDTIVAVDMPIGLPDFTSSGGRGPEKMVRQFLGHRQSSVFSIPSRTAVYAANGPFETIDDWYAAHRQASEVARTTSDPPRGVSIQAFGIFAKIREIDSLVRTDPRLRDHVFESHPEVAFWRLNGGRAMATPKKMKNRINPPGMAERRALLARLGLGDAFVAQPPPRGSGADDFLDACAMLFIAGRITRGEARPFPDPPGRDSHGIPIAIWA